MYLDGVLSVVSHSFAILNLLGRVFAILILVAGENVGRVAPVVALAFSLAPTPFPHASIPQTIGAKTSAPVRGLHSGFKLYEIDAFIPLI